MKKHGIVVYRHQPERTMECLFDLS